jgi:starch-binding outer membrane protein, SusD/RagB family
MLPWESITLYSMKKKFIKFCIILLACLSGGCDDWLDILPPDGLVFDEYWQTKEDVQSVLMGAYGQLASMSELLFIYGELRADLLAEGTAIPEEQRQIIRGNIFPENTLTNWVNFYRVINYCNNVIRFAPEVRRKDITFTEFEMETLISEAIVLRSMVYFYMVRSFKDVPYITEPSANDDIDFYPAKTDGNEILDIITGDLLRARIRLKGDYGNLAENKGRITQAATDALLADIYLWQFRYEEAIVYLDNIINSQKYFLMPTSLWFDIFSRGNTLEGIFELQFDNALGQNNILATRTHTNARYEVSDYAFELLDPAASREAIRGRGTISRQTTRGYLVWKYVGSVGDQISIRPASEFGSANYIIYRYADILLMKAEALSQLERYTEALAIINKIRLRALMPSITIPETPEAFEEAILAERAKELAFEGKRWFDLLRMGRRNNYANKDKLIEILVENVPSTQKLILASKLANPDGWYFPVFAREIENNVNLEQNSYYAN